MKATVTTMSTACEQRGITAVDTTASESKGVAFWRGTTYHGDAGSVLILFCDDTHQSRSQQQENEGIFKLKKNQTKLQDEIKHGAAEAELDTNLIREDQPWGSAAGTLPACDSSITPPGRSSAASVVRLTLNSAPVQEVDSITDQHDKDAAEDMDFLSFSLFAQASPIFAGIQHRADSESCLGAWKVPKKSCLSS